MWEKTWANGKILKHTDLVFSLGALHYGTVIFDGLLCIATKQKRYFLFRLQDHINRLFYSAGVLRLKVPYTKEELAEIIINLVRANGYGSYYIRPLIFERKMYFDIISNKKEKDRNVVILCKKFNSWSFFFHMKKRKVSVMVSKQMKNAWSEELTLAKISGKYLIYTLARIEAKENSYDEVVILDDKGRVSETSSSNIFIVKDNVIKTPLTKNVLPGITRATVIEFAKEINYQVQEENIFPEDLLNADEIFLTNSASGIISVSQIENRKLDKSRQYNIVKIIQNKYIDIITGRDPSYLRWLTPIII
jgi:branched-chain amino acid aminotransferase